MKFVLTNGKEFVSKVTNVIEAELNKYPKIFKSTDTYTVRKLGNCYVVIRTKGDTVFDYLFSTDGGIITPDNKIKTLGFYNFSLDPNANNLIQCITTNGIAAFYVDAKTGAVITTEIVFDPEWFTKPSEWRVKRQYCKVVSKYPEVLQYLKENYVDSEFAKIALDMIAEDTAKRLEKYDIVNPEEDIITSRLKTFINMLVAKKSKGVGTQQTVIDAITDIERTLVVQRKGKSKSKNITKEDGFRLLDRINSAVVRFVKIVEKEKLNKKPAKAKTAKIKPIKVLTVKAVKDDKKSSKTKKPVAKKPVEKKTATKKTTAKATANKAKTSTKPVVKKVEAKPAVKSVEPVKKPEVKSTEKAKKPTVKVIVRKTVTTKKTPLNGGKPVVNTTTTTSTKTIDKPVGKTVKSTKRTVKTTKRVVKKK